MSELWTGCLILDQLPHICTLFFTMNLIILGLSRTRVVCPNIGHPALASSFEVYALCKVCRHTMKIINHHSKAETISKLTVHALFLFFTCKNLYLGNDEVRVGCPKLEHTKLINYLNESKLLYLVMDLIDNE